MPPLPWTAAPAADAVPDEVVVMARRTFLTLSAWRDRDALNGFVRSEPHISTMRRYRPAMADARFVFWNMTPDNLPPSWSEAEQRLRASNADAKSPTATL